MRFFLPCQRIYDMNFSELLYFLFVLLHFVHDRISFWTKNLLLNCCRIKKVNKIIQKIILFYSQLVNSYCNWICLCADFSLLDLRMMTFSSIFFPFLLSNVYDCFFFSSNLSCHSFQSHFFAFRKLSSIISFDMF